MSQTERIFAVRTYEADDYTKAVVHLQYLLSDLTTEAFRSGRQVLWDTLELSTEENVMEEQTLTEAVPRIVSTMKFLRASVLAKTP